MMKFFSSPGYSSEKERCLRALKDFAKASAESENISIGFTRDVIEQVVKAMKDYKKDVEIQTNACKTLSNIAINSERVEDIVNAGGITQLKTTIENNCADSSTMWLACSALWNIAQRREFRENIGISGIRLVFKVIKNHKENPNVQETAVGALANLAVNSKYKTTIGTKENLRLFYSIMITHQDNARVQTSLSGLLTNLAHNEALSRLIGATGGVKLIIKAMETHPTDAHLQRNTCAALSNLTTTESNIMHVVRHYGVEALFQAYDLHDQFGIRQLADIAFENLGIQNGTQKTTSLHMACLLPEHESIGIVQEMLISGKDINSKDCDGKSPLDIAIMDNSTRLTEYLVTVGATPSFLDMDAVETNALYAISRGQKRNTRVTDLFIKTVYDTRQDIPYDIARLLVKDFMDPFDMTLALQDKE